MTSKERFLTALGKGVPDKVPIFEAYIDDPVVVRLAQILGPDESRAIREKSRDKKFEILDLYCFVIKKLGLDSTSRPFSTGMQPLEGKRGRDKFGTLWNLSDHGEPFPIDGPIKKYEDLKGFEMASKLHASDFEAVKYVIEKVGKEKAHVVLISNPFKISWNLRGSMETLLVDFILDPKLVHALARISTDFVKAAVDMSAQVGADAIHLTGDLAGEKTTLMSPTHYREYIKPYDKEIVDQAHRKGLKIVKHSDGNMWPILDDLVEIGVDGFHPVQPQCMDIGKVKQHLAGKACVLGNIDIRELLPYGKEEEVEKVVKETIEKAAPGGGYIISSSNTIHPACKAENYIAMVKAAHKYGLCY